MEEFEVYDWEETWEPALQSRVVDVRRNNRPNCHSVTSGPVPPPPPSQLVSCNAWRESENSFHPLQRQFQSPFAEPARTRGMGRGHLLRGSGGQPQSYLSNPYVGEFPPPCGHWNWEVDFYGLETSRNFDFDWMMDMEIIDYENKIHESETGTSSVDSVYVPVPDDLVEEREEIPAKNQRKPKPAKDESLPVPMPSTGRGRGQKRQRDLETGDVDNLEDLLGKKVKHRASARAYAKPTRRGSPTLNKEISVTVTSDAKNADVTSRALAVQDLQQQPGENTPSFYVDKELCKLHDGTDAAADEMLTEGSKLIRSFISNVESRTDVDLDVSLDSEAQLLVRKDIFDTNDDD